VSDILRPPGAPADESRSWPTADLPPVPPSERPVDPHPAGEVPGPPARPTPTQGAEAGGPLGDHRVRLLLLAAIVVGLGVMFGWSILLVVAAIVVSVFLHELGHFLVAKWAGMKVTEFFIGFGPRIWSFQRGETEYGLKVLPAGAYVRIIGMHSLEEVEPDEEERTYRSKSTPKRVAAVAAGPAMNLLIGLVLLVVINAGFGTPAPDRWEIQTVLPGSAAEAAGVEPGDRIVEWNGQPVGVYDEFVDTVRPLAGEDVEFVVERDGDRRTVTAPLGWALQPSGAALLPGLRSGDQVLAVDGQPVGSYQSFVSAMAAAEGTVEVTFEHEGSEYVARIAAPVTLPPEGARGLLGVRPLVPNETVGIVPATGDAFAKFGEIVVASVQGMGRLVSPEGLGNYARLFTADADESAPVEQSQVTPVDPGAPAPTVDTGSSPATEDRPMSIIGIVNVGAQIAEGQGIEALLFLLVIVNIFLGLINLVPLLPFDGGHIAVALYEAVRSKISGRVYRVDMTKLMPVTYVVVFLVVGLGLSSMYLDITNPVDLGQ